MVENNEFQVVQVLMGGLKKGLKCDQCLKRERKTQKLLLTYDKLY